MKKISMPGKGKIILASASPRRKELLTLAGIEFEVMPSDASESLLPGESPEDHVMRLALAKAHDVADKHEGHFFIGADTVVVCDGEIMGKPSDAIEAERMLVKLSGIVHSVITGFAVYDRERHAAINRLVTTRVFFKHLYPEEILAYVATGCPFDKAGGYAIQGGAAHMVERIDGSYTNVVGLPLCEVVEVLRTMGAIA